MTNTIRCGWCGTSEQVTSALCEGCSEDAQAILAEQEEQDTREEQEEAHRAALREEEDRLFLHSHIADFDDGFFA